MAKRRCDYCGKMSGKRYCPSLDMIICPVCCARNRLKNIACEESCRYLDNELYQQKIQEEKEFKTLLNNVPHSQHNDIYKDPEAASIAYTFETFFADCYIKGLNNLTDQKVKETLKTLYNIKYLGKDLKYNEFTDLTIQIFDNLIKDKISEELIGKVILRLIISVNKMTGGIIGPYGYLNYLKNNIHPDTAKDSSGRVMETKDGTIKIISDKDLESMNFD